MKTAVEWLVDKLMKGEFINDTESLIEQAKKMEKQQMIAFCKKSFYKGFYKCKNDDANCFTAWREEANELLTLKIEQ